MTFKCEADINEDINTTLYHSQGDTISSTIGGTIILSERQSEICKLIQENNKISVRDIVKILNINQSAVIKHLDNLKSMGILARVGGTRGYWIINQ